MNNLALDVVIGHERRPPSGWQQDTANSSAVSLRTAQAEAWDSFYRASTASWPPLADSWPAVISPRESNQGPVSDRGVKRPCKRGLDRRPADQSWPATGPGGPALANFTAEISQPRTHCRKLLQLGIEGFGSRWSQPLR